MRNLFLIFIAIALGSCLGKNKMEAAVIEQADAFGKDLVRGQFDEHIDKMAHFVFANQQERQKLKQQLADQRSYLSDRNTTMVRAVSYMHSDIYENEGYYQCYVKQITYFSNEYTTYDADVYLLAISEDGEKWKFADVTNLSDKLIRAVFPEMHPDLKLGVKIIKQ